MRVLYLLLVACPAALAAQDISACQVASPAAYPVEQRLTPEEDDALYRHPALYAHANYTYFARLTNAAVSFRKCKWLEARHAAFVSDYPAERFVSNDTVVVRVKFDSVGALAVTYWNHIVSCYGGRPRVVVTGEVGKFDWVQAGDQPRTVTPTIQHAALIQLEDVRTQRMRSVAEWETWWKTHPNESCPAKPSSASGRATGNSRP